MKIPFVDKKTSARIVDSFATKLGRLLNTKMCFVAGTPIHTLEGLKNIEDIRVGDMVLTRPEAADERYTHPEYRPVKELITTNPDELFHITYRTPEGDADTLVSTGAHPFFIIEAGEFVNVSDIEAGQTLSLPEGRTATITTLTQELAKPGQPFTTYNFAVEEHRTYFAGKLGVWVHNTSQAVCMQMQDKFDEILEQQMEDRTFDISAAREEILAWVKQQVDDDIIDAATARQHIKDFDHLAGIRKRRVRDNSYDVGEQLGRKHAEDALGLKDPGIPWVNPRAHRGSHGQGLDDVMVDSDGNIWIVEYKGESAELKKGQMGRQWVQDKIQEIQDDAPWSPWGKILQDAFDDGELRGVAIRSTGGPNGISEVVGEWKY